MFFIYVRVYLCVIGEVCMYVLCLFTRVSMFDLRIMYVFSVFICTRVACVICQLRICVLYLYTCVSLCDWRSGCICSVFIYVHFYV